MKHTGWLWMAFFVALCPLMAEPGPIEVGFETTPTGTVPTTWDVPSPVTEAGYLAAVTDVDKHTGEQALSLRHPSVPPQGNRSIGGVNSSLDATPFRGQRIVLRAWAKPDRGSQANLWLRIDGEDGKRTFFANLGDQLITRSEWVEYELVAPVVEQAGNIAFGLLLQGGGQVLLDDLRIEAVGAIDAGNEPARPLDEQALERLETWAHIVGLVRYFHPSDQVANADWHEVIMAGVETLEASAPTSLAARIAPLLAPLAPTATIRDDRFEGGDRPQATHPERGSRIVWRHLGVGLGPSQVYKSERIAYKDEDLDTPETMSLPSGLELDLPLTVWRVASGVTVPEVEGDTPRSSKPPYFVSSGNDRTTRLSVVIEAWALFRHFYPYFDVVDTDWDAALRAALKAAATDDGESFVDTLGRLVAALHDGHGGVGGPIRGTAMIPLGARWLGDELVVTSAGPGSRWTHRPG
ncbi:MAG: hypothetical protein AAGD38_20915 [Acidobacteriota bacterium]